MLKTPEQKTSKTLLYLNWLKGYAQLLLISLTMMTGLRVLWFLTYKQGDEIQHYFKDLLHALWLGLRFDLSAFCYLSIISLIPWLSWIIIGSHKSYFTMVTWQRRLWLLLLLLLGLILYGDYTYYGFFQDHFNALIFGFFQDDTVALLKTFWKNYPLIKIAFISTALLWLFNIWMQKIWKVGLSEELPPQSKVKHKLFLFLVVLTMSLGARGTLGLFPLEIMHTAISSHPLINTLSFNGAHALARAIQLYDQQHQHWDENLLQLGYDSNPEAALSDFLNSLTIFQKSNSLKNSNLLASTVPTPSNPYFIQRTSTKSNFSPPHVILVLMESWGSDWLKQQTPEFNIMGALKNHIDHDFFTPNIFPSSMATIGSLGSLMVDLPHRFYSPFLTESLFLGVPFSTAPARLFQKQGYQTHFIYGGNLGWRSIDRFLPRQGFQQLHGDNAIKEKFHDTPDDELLHEWGVFDQYVFEYAFDLLSHSTTPQFIVILTTSNHPPYSLPKSYNSPIENSFTTQIEKDLIGDLDLAKSRLKAYQYSNHQLGLFISKIKNQPFATQTIVAATGDHSFYIRPYNNLEFFEKWCVPLYLYIPPQYTPHITTESILQTKQKFSLTIGSHLDLFPTLYNLTFSNLIFKGLGQNLLDPRIKPWSFHTTSWSSFDENSGIIINPKGQIITSLCRTDKSSNKLEPCPQDRSHLNLQKRLTSLMGVSDFIYEQERKESLK